jgi:predicted dehydrogenase
MTFITGLRVEEVYADFKTFLTTRKKPAKPVETFTGKTLQPSEYVDQPIQTEDYATILLHYEKGVRGVVTVAQVCAGRKNRPFLEINGSKSSLAWDGEHPNELWIGHRTAPNQVLMKDPSLLGSEARATASYPGGHAEGFPDTFKQLYKKVYDYIFEGDFDKPADFPTFADGHYEMVLCDAIAKSAKEGKWVKVG